MVVGTLSLSLSALFLVVAIARLSFPYDRPCCYGSLSSRAGSRPPFGHNNTASRRERGKWEENISCPAARRARKSERESELKV